MFKKIVLLMATCVLLIAHDIKLDLNAKYCSNNFHTKGTKKFAALVDKYTN